MPKITKAGGPTIATTYPVGILQAPQVEVVADRPRSLVRASRSANKAAWVAYAQGRGINVDGLTKKQIIARIDG